MTTPPDLVTIDLRLRPVVRETLLAGGTLATWPRAASVPVGELLAAAILDILRGDRSTRHSTDTDAAGPAQVSGVAENPAGKPDSDVIVPHHR